MTNGLISFNTPFPTFFNQIFPGGVSTLFLVAPFWDDVNTNIGGTISYEIHTSGDMMEQVSAYIQQQTSADFEGYWMMVVLWDSVPPFSFFGATDDVSKALHYKNAISSFSPHTGKYLSGYFDHRQ